MSTATSVDKYRTYFDNEFTLKYKMVTKYKVPTTLIVMLHKQPLVYDSLLNYMSERLTQGQTLVSIFESIVPLNPGINIGHYVYAYIKTQDPTLQHWQTTAQRLVELFQKYSPQNVSLLSLQGVVRDNAYNMLTNYMQVVTTEVDGKLKEETLVVQELDGNLIMLQDTLSGNGVFKHWKQTPTVIVSRTIELYPKHRHNIKDGIYIFDRILTSEYVPYVRLINTNTDESAVLEPDVNNFYKMYTGPGTDNEDYYRAVTVSDPEVERGPAIYITVWLGDEKFTNIGNSDPLLFVPVLFNLKEGYITLTGVNEIRGKKIDGINICIDRLRKCLPDFDLGEPKEVKIKAEYNLIPLYPEYPASIQKFITGPRTNTALYHKGQKQFELYEHIFNHLIMFYTVIGRNIYIEESVTPSPLKKRLDYHYRYMYSDVDEYITPKTRDYISNSANISFNLKVMQAKANSSWIDVDKDQKELGIIGLEEGYSYIRVSISRAGSLSDLKEFQKILPSMLDIYWWNILGSSKPPADLMYYDKLVPSISNLVLIKEKISLLKKKTELTTGKSRVTSERMQELMKQWPTIFKQGYTNHCNAKRLPITVSTIEEAEKWTQLTHSKRGKTINRQYMPFPPPSISPTPLFYVICPDDELPYPSLILNKSATSDSDIPVLPCCNAKDQRTGEGNLYGQYYLGIKPQETQKESEHIVSERILKFKQTGYLPYSVTSTIRYYRVEAGEFYRYGIIPGPNALLEAVLFAVDSDFREYATTDMRQKYVHDKRRQIGQDIKVDCMKQELYDMTDAEIRSEVIDPNIVLDSSRHFRMIEYAFGINIICFVATEKYNTDEGELEIPRHLDFHLRKINKDKPTVLLFKHWGSRADGLTHPHYELIIEETSNVYDNRLIYDVEMSALCQDMVEKIQSKITWIPDSMFVSPYLNLFDNWPLKPDILSNVVSQYIDSSGKRRAITWKQDGHNITLWHLPNIPLNVPHTDVIERVSYDVLIKTFKPEKYTINFWSGYSYSNDMVTGLWMTANEIQNTLYVPIKPISLEKLTMDTSMMKSREDPTLQIVEVKRTSQIQRYSNLKRILHIVRELILWVWNIAKYEVSGDKKYMEDPRIVEQFITNVFVKGSTTNIDSVNVYDISKVQYVLPTIVKVLDAIAYLKYIMPSLIRDNKIYLYSPKFYDGICDMLRRHFRATRGEEIKIQTTISNYYSHSIYFIKQPNTTVWLGKDYKTWYEIKLRKYEPYTIYRDINLTIVDTNVPYLYEDYDGAIYMIQNPEDGSIEAAATIAKKWKEEHKNVGAYIKEDDLLLFEEIPAVMIYGIGINGNLVPIFDNTYGDTSYLELIYYGTNTTTGTHLKLRSSSTPTSSSSTPFETSGSFSTWGTPNQPIDSTISSRYGALIRLL